MQNRTLLKIEPDKKSGRIHRIARRMDCIARSECSASTKRTRIPQRASSTTAVNATSQNHEDGHVPQSHRAGADNSTLASISPGIYALIFSSSFAAALSIFVHGYFSYLNLSTSGDILDSATSSRSPAFPRPASSPPSRPSASWSTSRRQSHLRVTRAQTGFEAHVTFPSTRLAHELTHIQAAVNPRHGYPESNA